MRKVAKLLTGLAAAGFVAGCQDDGSRQEIEALRGEVMALQDRNAIQDLLYGYYARLGSDGSHDLNAFFTEDAVFEINGAVFNGRDEIQALYDGLQESDEDIAATAEIPPEMQEVHLSLLNNPRVVVDGDKATAQMIWTGTANETAFAKPTLFDQGREYDRLEKQADGSWLISKRVVIADGFLPRSMLDTWERKWDYDINAE